jgi:activating signal cointegrator 1
MKALSLRQPFAGLVALGEKRIETRSWSTAYRGFLAIHAAKGRAWELDPVVLPYVQGVLAKHHLERLPDDRGCIVALCTLEDVVSIPDYRNMAGVIPMSLTELAFGDYHPGRYMWKLTNIRRIKTPIPWAGSLGVFECPAALIYGIAAEVVV